MKKRRFLLLILFMFLTACIRPPVPDIEQAASDAIPNAIVPLNNHLTTGYFKTALPLEASPTRGLIHSHIRNRADIEQVEMSLMRLATDFFNPDDYIFREGLHLSREFVSTILQPFNPEIENHQGLNPQVGSSHTFANTTIESLEDDLVRPLAYVLEQNFVTVEDDAFKLEGAAIAIALNPYHWLRDPSIGFEAELRMTDQEIVEIGQQIASNFLPLLRAQEGLEEVPIILALFILRSEREVIPGNFASITYVEAGSFTINSWDNVDEAHFRLPTDSGINVYDVNIIEEFNFFSNSIGNNFPHRYGLTAQVHVVDGEIYRVLIVFDMNFYGLSEKIGFHQLVGEQIMYFSPEHDIRITIRSPNEVHGFVLRPPFALEAAIQRINW